MPFSLRAYRSLGIVLAILLVTAALSKSYANPTDLHAKQTTANRLQIACELLLGFSLLLGLWPRLIRTAAILAFGLFALVAGWHVVIASNSCGCFGRFTVPPWLSLTTDTAILVALTRLRPDSSTPRQVRNEPVKIAAIIVATALLFSAQLGTVASAPGSQMQTKGELPTPYLLTLDSQNLELDLGYVPSGATKLAHVKMTNSSNVPLFIKTVDSSCQCLVPSGWPLQIPVGGTGDLQLELVAPTDASRYGKLLTFETNQVNPSIQIRVTARIGLPLAIKPETLFVKESPHPQVEPVVQIINDGDESLRLLYSTSSDPAVIVLTPTAPVPPHGQHPIPIRVAQEAMRANKAVVTVHTTSKTQPTLEFAVRKEDRPAVGEILDSEISRRE